MIKWVLLLTTEKNINLLFQRLLLFLFIHVYMIIFHWTTKLNLKNRVKHTLNVILIFPFSSLESQIEKQYKFKSKLLLKQLSSFVTRLIIWLVLGWSTAAKNQGIVRLEQSISNSKCSKFRIFYIHFHGLLLRQIACPKNQVQGRV